jgi:magnesium-transporting ATPase (P-type)
MSMNDRSNLYKLYPEVKNNNNQTNLTEVVPVKNFNPKLSFVHILSIAILLTATIVMFVQFSNFLNQNVDKNNIVNLLSGILLILAFWVVSLVFVLLVTFKRLSNTGISKLNFLILYAICVLPISQLIYNLYYHFNHGVVSILPLSAILFVENLVFVFFILRVMNSEKLSEKVQNILLLSVIILCVLVAIIGGVYVK